MGGQEARGGAGEATVKVSREEKKRKARLKVKWA